MLLRTLAISASVTLLCLVLGFPVALLLTQVRERTADWLMVLVLLPFWTSLLVRTGAVGGAAAEAKAWSTACC